MTFDFLWRIGRELPLWLGHTTTHSSTYNGVFSWLQSDIRERLGQSNKKQNCAKFRLGTRLLEKYLQHKNPAHLDGTISLLEQIKQYHSNRFRWGVLNSLAFALVERWKRRRGHNITDLSRAIDLCATLIEELPEDDPLLHSVQRDIAWALKERWQKRYKPADLNRSIFFYKVTLLDLPQVHPNRLPLQRHLASVLEERLKFPQNPTDDLNFLIELRSSMLRAVPTAKERAILRVELACSLYQRSRLLLDYQARAQQACDLSRCIEIFTLNFHNKHLPDPQRETQRRAFQQALVAYIEDFGSFAGLRVPVSVLLAVRPWDHQHPVTPDVAILRSLLERYNTSHHGEYLNEAVSFASSFFPSVDENDALLPIATLLVCNLVDSLVDSYDKSGRVRCLEQSTTLLKTCLERLCRSHPQHAVLSASLAKVQSRRVPILVVSDKETTANAAGGYSVVYRGQVDEQLVALKVPKLSNIEEENQEQKDWFLNEIHLWRRVRHRYILELLGMCEEDGEVCVISPWCPNGNCLSYLRKHPMTDRLKLLCQIAEALVYLHGFSPIIVHGDIKGENVLIDDSGNALLGDFGLSMLQTFDRGDEENRAAISHANAGSWRCMAPELFTDDERQDRLGNRRWMKTTKTDVYAFGCLIFQIITGHQPFSNVPFYHTVVIRVTQGQRPQRPQVFQNDDLWSLCLRCWAQVAGSRPTMKEVLGELHRIHGQP